MSNKISCRWLTQCLSILCCALALLVPDWKTPLTAQTYSNTPYIQSVTLADNSFGQWGDDIAPEPDCYDSVGNCPGKQFFDNSNTSIPNGKTEWNSGTATSNVTTTTFTARYQNELRAQSQTALTAAMYYKPRFKVTVVIAGDGRWTLATDISRIASIQIVKGGSGSSNRIDVSNVSTSLSGGTIGSGALSLAALPRYSSEGVYPVSQTNSATISGNGPATLVFTLAYDINTRIQGATLSAGDAVCWTSGQSNQGASIGCNPSPTAQQGLWLNGTLHVNTPPTTQADNYSVDTSGTFTVGNVLTNDSDAEGDTLSVLGIDTTGTRGIVTDNGNGTFNYNGSVAFGYLNTAETATDVFYYRASDGEAASALTPVTITIHGTVPTVLPLDGLFSGSLIRESSVKQ